MTSIIFVTYNLNCNSPHYEERLNAFLKQMQTKPPDIVVIQEGTRLTFEKLLREMGKLGYKRFLPDIMHSRQVGEMIFSKFPITQTRYILFGSLSGLTIAQIDIWGKRGLWIVTTQLAENTATRRQQIHDIPTLTNFIPSSDIIIFGGDTRILEYQDFTAPEGWYDAWYEAGSEAQKFTLNSETNLLVQPPFKDRPDRVWFRPGKNGSKIECVDCKLIGRDSDTTISPHYGLKVRFVM